MRYDLYFWREDQPIEAAADSLLQRLAADRNPPGIDRLSLSDIKDTFRHHFPDIAVGDYDLVSEASGGSFRVSFSFDELNRPTSICVSSQDPLVENPDVFNRIFAAVREVGCTRIESAIR